MKKSSKATSQIRLFLSKTPQGLKRKKPMSVGLLGFFKDLLFVLAEREGLNFQ